MALLTLEDIKNDVLAHGFSAQNYSARIDNWANEAQQKIFRKADLLEGSYSQTINTEVGKYRYLIEQDFARVEAVHIKSNEPDTRLTPFESTADFDEQDKLPNGEPSRYLIFYDSELGGNSIWLNPTPNNIYEILIRYKKIAVTLENPSDKPAIPFDYIYLIVEYCLYKAYLAEGDIEMSNIHKSIFDKDLVQFTDDVQSSRNDGPTQVEGSWPLGYE